MGGGAGRRTPLTAITKRGGVSISITTEEIFALNNARLCITVAGQPRVIITTKAEKENKTLSLGDEVLSAARKGDTVGEVKFLCGVLLFFFF